MPMPTIEAACGFIIMARISSPRRLERIHNTTPINMAIEHTTMPILSAVNVMSKSFTFQRPNRSGNDFDVGPKIMRKS